MVPCSPRLENEDENVAWNQAVSYLQSVIPLGRGLPMMQAEPASFGSQEGSESYNQKLVCIGRDLKDHPFPTPAMS